MQREIEFRGVRKYPMSEWLYGDLSHVDGDTYIFPLYGMNSPDYYEVIPETVSQYIGFKDINGVKIYEGSIIRWDDLTNGDRWRVAVVELYPSLQFRIIKIECDFKQSGKEGSIFSFSNFMYKEIHKHIEIIGNIHTDKNILTANK